MTHLIVGGLRTTFLKLKLIIDLKNQIWQLTFTGEIESTVDDATYLIGTTTANQQYETITEEHMKI